MKNDIVIGIGFILLIVLLIIVGPLIVIWALNTLFGLGIAYTFWTWLAALILSASFGKTSVTVKK
jgi:hypothetical protein